jgi:hypothetical protein
MAWIESYRHLKKKKKKKRKEKKKEEKVNEWPDGPDHLLG